MDQFDNEVLDTFLENQLQLFPEEVAESMESPEKHFTPEEAEEFLEDCMAVVCENEREVKEYFEEEGLDISGMSMDDILEQSEVFSLPSGRFLIVEG